MKYRFWGWEHADAKAITAEYKGIETPVDLYDALSHVWCADTCAPRMRQNWTKENMTLGQLSLIHICSGFQSVAFFWEPE